MGLFELWSWCLRELLAAGKSSTDIYNSISKGRTKQGVAMVNITAIRRYIRGSSHKRGSVETRGRKRAFSRRSVLAMDAARRKFIKETKGGRPARWGVIRAKARVPKAHRTTVARAK